MKTIKRELNEIDSMVKRVKSIKHEASRNGLLLRLVIMRNEVAKRIGMSKR